MPDETGFTNGLINFMKSGKVQLAYMGSSGYQSPISMCTPGAVARTLEFPSGTKFKLKVTHAGTNKTIVIEPNTGSMVDNGIRYLPWKPDRCTYTCLDTNAKLIFTGPLTGCNVYVAGPPDAPVLFHTNSNTSADNYDLNNRDKQSMALNLLAANVLGLPANTVIGGRLERKMYSQNYLGFVFGFKQGGNWLFYFNGIGANSTYLRRIM